MNDRRLAFSVTSVSSPRDVIAVAVMMGSSLALLSKVPGRAVSLTLAERGLELWVRNQSDFAGFRWCYGKQGEEVSTGTVRKGG